MSALSDQTKPQHHWHYLIWLMVVLTLLVSLLITRRLEWDSYFNQLQQAVNVQSGKPTLAARPASLKLELLPGTATASALTPGSTYQAAVIIETTDIAVVGADAKLTFDPQSMNITAVKKGSIFTTYPAAVFDNDNGTVTISGITSAGKTYAGRGVLATIGLIPLAAGNISLDFDFEPGATRDSNVADTQGNDLLGSVQNLSLTIGE